MDFDGKGYCQREFNDGKIHVRVTREEDYVDENNPAMKSELGFAADASESRHVYMPPGDLFLGDSTAIAHELSHMLQFRQTEWGFVRLLQEGYAEYTAYLTVRELEQSNPDLAYYLDRSESCLFNMMIDNYNLLFQHPLEYWFENDFSGSMNGLYSVGFRFMGYLQAVYGDYSKWITDFEKNYKTYSPYNAEVSDQIQSLKRTYGEDVLDNFYPWLQENMDVFGSYESTNIHTDRTGMESLNLYPHYYGHEHGAMISHFKYKDLYVNLEPTRKYIGEYQGEDTSDLYLVTPTVLKLGLFKNDGSYTVITTMPLEPVPLDGISYFKVMGEENSTGLK